MSEKHAAAYHPSPLHYECVDCGKMWATPSASGDCCGPWLGDLDDNVRGYN